MRLQKLLPEYDWVGPPDSGASAVVCTTADAVYRAMQQNYPAENVFFLPSAEEEPRKLPQGCRPVACSMEQLIQINRAAASEGGPLRSVGLRLIPFGYNADAGIPVEKLTDVAKLLPSLTDVTVRGCFVRGDLDGLHGKELGRFFRACYESAKRMTVILPCAMPYLCVENALAALSENRLRHPETLEDALTAARIVAMQNRTAFYARLLIS